MKWTSLIRWIPLARGAIPSYPPIFMTESVETLRDEAAMPKIKSGQQALIGGQSNLMLDAKQVVGRSIRPRRVKIMFAESNGRGCGGKVMSPTLSG